MLKHKLQSDCLFHKNSTPYFYFIPFFISQVTLFFLFLFLPCVIVFFLLLLLFIYFRLSPCELTCSDIILIKMKHCSACDPCEGSALPLSGLPQCFSSCCLTSFPLLLYLIRDPVLQCGNEACVRRATPPGILGAPAHLGEAERHVHIDLILFP